MTKRILCTLGPASLNPVTIRRLAELRVDMFRLNLSHTPIERLEEWVALIRANSDVPVCFDTQGAQVRTGTFRDREVVLNADTTVRIAPAPTTGTDVVVPLYPGSVVEQLRVGDLISLDFNSALLQVFASGDACEARTLCPGMVGSNKAVSIDRRLPLAPITADDRLAMDIATRLGIRHVALSFASCRSDIQGLRAVVGADVEIIAKVESRQGIEHLDEILDEADAILIDRGDLSREVPLESIPLIQKAIIRRANRGKVPVYVATNLLESMVLMLQPTRAEVNDVMNTLLDGADGLVLAAETAIGRHPISCVGMIRSLIGQFERDANGDEPTMQVTQNLDLVPPHGGRLVRRIRDLTSNAIAELPSVEADIRVAMDISQIAVGTFSPLDGFMDRENLRSVLDRNRLADGTVWPLPIVFQLPPDVRESDLTHGPLRITLNGEPYALLDAREYFQWDLRDLAERWFGTDSPRHPGVARLLAGSDRFVAGPVDLSSDVRRQPFELTPAQARTAFANRHWRKVIGFHTRNLPHRAHEHLQITALSDHHCDGVFVHPVIGPKKSGDCAGEVVVRAYQLLIAHYYPGNSAIVSGFATYSRYAGPREALFTALCRQNFGCSHFIVGRDHTGVADFYPHDASQRFIESMAHEIGIQPIFCDEVYYCRRCEQHVTGCEHGPEHHERVSGTKARDMLKEGDAPPDWLMREPVVRLIRDELHKGTEVFIA